MESHLTVTAPSPAGVRWETAGSSLDTLILSAVISIWRDLWDVMKTTMGYKNEIIHNIRRNSKAQFGRLIVCTQSLTGIITFLSLSVAVDLEFHGIFGYVIDCVDRTYLT